MCGHCCLLPPPSAVLAQGCSCPWGMEGWLLCICPHDGKQGWGLHCKAGQGSESVLVRDCLAPQTSSFISKPHPSLVQKHGRMPQVGEGQPAVMGQKEKKEPALFCNSDKIFGSEKKVKKRLRVLEYEAERTRAQEVTH